MDEVLRTGLSCLTDTFGMETVLTGCFGAAATGSSSSKSSTSSSSAFLVEFLEKFGKKYASCSCKGLLKHDIADPEDMQKILAEGLLFDFCPEVVKDTIEILKEVM